jgi:hypothetical protein
MDLRTFSPKLWSMLDLQMQQYFFKNKMKHEIKKSIMLSFDL